MCSTPAHEAADGVAFLGHHGIRGIVIAALLAVARALGGGEAAGAAWAKDFNTAGMVAYESALVLGATSPATAPGMYSVGDTVTLADVCLVPAVWGAVRWGVDLEGLCPRLMAVFRNLSKLEEVKKAHWQGQPDCPASLRADSSTST